MNKKMYVLLLAIVLLCASLFGFYASNLLFSDVSNMFFGVHDVTFISSLPAFMVELDLVCLAIYLLRSARYPERRRAMRRLYSSYLLANSLIGFLSSILTGTIVYRGFLAPYPFPGYTLLFLSLNALLFGLSVALLILNKRSSTEGQIQKKIKPKYVIYSAFLGILCFLACYDFGAFLWMPVYVQLRTLYLTFPFYLSLLCPMLLFLHVAVYFFDGYKNHERVGIAAVSVIGILCLGLNVAVALIGARHTAFISAISPALPLERLASLPLHTILMIALSIVLPLYFLFYAIRSLKLSKKDADN